MQRARAGQSCSVPYCPSPLHPPGHYRQKGQLCIHLPFISKASLTCGYMVHIHDSIPAIGKRHVNLTSHPICGPPGPKVTFTSLARALKPTLLFSFIIHRETHQLHHHVQQRGHLCCPGVCFLKPTAFRAPSLLPLPPRNSQGRCLSPHLSLQLSVTICLPSVHPFVCPPICSSLDSKQAVHSVFSVLSPGGWCLAWVHIGTGVTSTWWERWSQSLPCKARD